MILYGPVKINTLKALRLLRKRSYIHLLAKIAFITIEIFGAKVKIFHPEGFLHNNYKPRETNL
jgi:hypothetical protein